MGLTGRTPTSTCSSSYRRSRKTGRHGLTVELARAITAPVPVDLLLTDPAEIAERGDLPGMMRVALREGRVGYERPG
jgi:hypothetical protein